MTRAFAGSRKFWVAFVLLSVSFRVFTGAPEAQVNFSSLFVDHQTRINVVAHDNVLLHHSAAENPSDANSIPEKHHTYSTYKKYVTPDNHYAVLPHEFHNVEPNSQKTRFTGIAVGYQHTLAPTSHSPPAVVSARSLTHTTTTDSSVVLEKKFEELTFNNGSWGLSGI